MKAIYSAVFLFLFFVPHTTQARVADTLRVGYTEAPPFVFEQNGQLQGINIWLWNKLSDTYGLEYTLEAMEFDALLSGLEKGTLDLSLNPLTQTSERLRRFDFTQPFYASNAAIAVVEPGSFRKFTQWIGSFLNSNFLSGMMVLLGVIFAFGFAGWYFERRKNHQEFRPGFKGLWDGIWWSAVTLTTVGYGDKAPRTRWGKTAALALMFGGMLFISGLTASIASSLTIDQLSGQPEGLDAFKKRAVGAVERSSTQAFLANQLFRDIHGFRDVDSGLKALQGGKINAFIHDEPILRYRIISGGFEKTVSVLPYKFDPQFYGFGMAKGHDSLRVLLSEGILEARESPAWRVTLNEFGLSDL